MTLGPYGLDWQWLQAFEPAGYVAGGGETLLVKYPRREISFSSLFQVFSLTVSWNNSKCNQRFLHKCLFIDLVHLVFLTDGRILRRLIADARQGEIPDREHGTFPRKWWPHDVTHQLAMIKSSLAERNIMVKI